MPTNAQPQDSAAPNSGAGQKPDRVLRLIAGFKLLEGFLILSLAVGVLKLLHHDVAGMVSDWIRAIRVDPDNRYAHLLLAKLGLIDDHRLKEISAGSFVYAALRFTEGGGLFFRKRWAEYFTAIATGMFIPVEVHEIYVHVSLPKAALLVVNVAVVWYLVAQLQRGKSAALELPMQYDPSAPRVEPGQAED
ncbi:MAG TPA: DUF2127 domain-containing protein [Pirellulales bacterium]|nr:DUF2127 domain-containing protein [Pirellulales bacterium]